MSVNNSSQIAGTLNNVEISQVNSDEKQKRNKIWEGNFEIASLRVELAKINQENCELAILVQRKLSEKMFTKWRVNTLRKKYEKLKIENIQMQAIVDSKNSILKERQLTLKIFRKWRMNTLKKPLEKLKKENIQMQASIDSKDSTLKEWKKIRLEIKYFDLWKEKQRKKS